MGLGGGFERRLPGLWALMTGLNETARSVGLDGGLERRLGTRSVGIGEGCEWRLPGLWELMKDFQGSLAFDMQERGPFLLVEADLHKCINAQASTERSTQPMS